MPISMCSVQASICVAETQKKQRRSKTGELIVDFNHSVHHFLVHSMALKHIFVHTHHTNIPSVNTQNNRQFEQSEKMYFFVHAFENAENLINYIHTKFVY